ncbi:Hypothetical predicted protein [Mytilus galloprovincialis]|uniref:TLDc domain-containing protein n=1 Tax=Mytilus galloprovincialis TaxID=29158 RepID=A0A8B6EGI2_MYTGA|nr:Hypothetical predicted protein [Mytilus galloprovincialis]
MIAEFKKEDRSQMTKWIGGMKKYTLLYKASGDGCTSTAFHNACNNKGPTVTILYNHDNFIYGGYTSVSWRSIGNFQTDTKSFLFKLYQNDTWSPVKMPIANYRNSIYDHADFGPTFGDRDLQTFSGKVKFDGTIFNLNGKTNFGSSYTVNDENYKSIANGNLRVKDIEVYLVEEEPWRKTPKWNTMLLAELKEKIEKYRPLPGLKIPQARILLVGQVGSGKSSFYNTINSIFRGYITSQACSGNAEHSLTTVYRMYQIRKGIRGKPMNFRLHDTRGIEADQGVDANEICYLLDGNIQDGYQFNPSVPVSTDTLGFVDSAHVSETIHCVVLVLDGTTVDVMAEKVAERLKKLQMRMNQRGIPQVVLLTKIDKICERTEEDLSNVFYSPLVKETVERVSQIMGLPRSHILPVKNYESEMDLNDNVNILALMSLQQILHFADDYMYNHLDKHKEGISFSFHGMFRNIIIITMSAVVCLLAFWFYK